LAERLAIGALLRRDRGTAEASIRAGFARLAPEGGDVDAVVARALLFLADEEWAARMRRADDARTRGLPVPPRGGSLDAGGDAGDGHHRARGTGRGHGP